eukprot:gene20047-36206_t
MTEVASGRAGGGAGDLALGPHAPARFCLLSFDPAASPLSHRADDDAGGATFVALADPRGRAARGGSGGGDGRAGLRAGSRSHLR